MGLELSTQRWSLKWLFTLPAVSIGASQLSRFATQLRGEVPAWSHFYAI